MWAFGALEPLDCEHDPLDDWKAMLRGDPCSYCGGRFEAWDHITARHRGGQDVWWNLTATCTPCNSAKRERSLLHFLANSTRSRQARPSRRQPPLRLPPLRLNGRAEPRAPMVVTREGWVTQFRLDRTKPFTRMDQRVACALLRECRSGSDGLWAPADVSRIAGCVGRDTAGRRRAVRASLERLCTQPAEWDLGHRWGAMMFEALRGHDREIIRVQVNARLLRVLGHDLVLAKARDLPSAPRPLGTRASRSATTLALGWLS
jgi:HNH endonuclease